MQINYSLFLIFFLSSVCLASLFGRYFRRLRENENILKEKVISRSEYLFPGREVEDVFVLGYNLPSMFRATVAFKDGSSQEYSFSFRVLEGSVFDIRIVNNQD